MEISREQFVNEALAWRGTPFKHMARLKGVACDCVGLVIGVCRTLGIEVEDMKLYPRFPINGVFGSMVDKQTSPVGFEDILPGDLMKFQWTNEPQHLAIVISVNPIRIIHAYGEVKRVVISDYDKVWQARFTDARRLKVFA